MPAMLAAAAPTVGSGGGFPYLTLLVLLPAGAGLLAALMPKSIGERAQRRAVEVIGVVGSVGTLVVACFVTARFRLHDAGFQMVSHHQWAPSLGVSWYLGIDGISLFLVLLAAVLFPLALLGGRVRRDPRAYVAWLLLLEAGCLGSFVSLDLILFFVFFEFTLVPVYFIIAGWGFARRQQAAIKFFVYTFLGSAFLMVGVVAVAIIHQHQTGVFTFDLPALASTHLGLASQVLIFAAFTAAFAVKAPIFPFHTWSPDAYSESPTAGVVILAAVMAKLGTYGIVRFDLTLFPRAVVDAAPVLLTLGVAGILYGAVVACVQRNLKRLMAYSSLAHIGFIILGTFALTTQAVTGGVLQMVNHGLVTAALFLIIGWIARRRGSWQTTALRGLQRPAPMMAAAFTVAMMASLGLPGLNSFVGEFLILSGTFLSHRWWAVVATVGVVLAAVYLLWAYQRVFHRQPTPEDLPTKDISWGEGVVILPLIALIIFLGVYPKPVLDRITPSVDALLHHVEQATGSHQPTVTGRVTTGPGRTGSSSTAGRAVTTAAGRAVTAAGPGRTATGSGQTAPAGAADVTATHVTATFGATRTPSGSGGSPAASTPERLP